MKTNSSTSTNLGFSIKILSLVCLLVVTYFLKNQLKTPSTYSAEQTNEIEQFSIDKQFVSE